MVDLKQFMKVYVYSNFYIISYKKVLFSTQCFYQY